MVLVNLTFETQVFQKSFARMLRVWIGGWRHVEHLDPTRAHTGPPQLGSRDIIENSLWPLR